MFAQFLTGPSPGLTGGRGAEGFPDPFMDAASLAMPRTIYEALRWAEYLLLSQGTYREALSRVISYFITDVKIEGADADQRLGREEREKYRAFLEETLGIKSVLYSVALDFVTYGNSFTSLYVPFRRSLACPKCGVEAPLRKIAENPAFAFAWKDFSFHARCPSCEYTGPFRHIDRRTGEKGDIRVLRWSPHEIEIIYDPFTRECAYVWRIPEWYRTLLRQGRLYHLERAPWEVLQAVKEGKNLLFDPDVIYHMKEEPPAGILARGWGIPRVIVNFRQAFYVAVLHRYNEAIALDYVIPFRVLTPMPRPSAQGGAEDPVLSLNMGSFVSRVAGMIRRRRQDPARWNILPFPIQYQALGGDATQLAPKELLEFGYDVLLNAIGIPVELYKGSLSVQAMPGALRLFEANWSHLVYHLNTFCRRLGQQISQTLNWEPVNLHLERVTHADDLDRQMAKLQLMMGGQISKTTGLASVGISNDEEVRQILEEQRTQAEATKEQEDEMAQAAMQQELAPSALMSIAQGGAPGMPGAVPGAGAPGTPGTPAGAAGGPSAATMFGAGVGTVPGVAKTPEQMQQEAQVHAQRALMLPESQKDSYLIQLKRKDPVMHALTSAIIDDIRRQAQTQGGAMIMAQQFGQGAQGMPM